MGYIVATDTSANLTAAQVKDNELLVVPFSYYIDGTEHTCLDLSAFDGGDFYGKLKEREVTTSLVTPQRYIEYLEPGLRAGEDILFVGMSSGISGSFATAVMAAKQLRKKYPHRRLRLVDTLSASLGEGLITLKAAALRAAGKGIDESVQLLTALRKRICQVFTVDDLMFLHKGGRMSKAVALAGTLLQIKPLLKGNDEGKIVPFGKARGYKAALRALADRYEALAVRPEEQTIAIAHADCEDRAEYLAGLLRAKRPPREIITVCYEPVTGSHVGPNTVALFFEGTDRAAI